MRLPRSATMKTGQKLLQEMGTLALFAQRRVAILS